MVLFGNNERIEFEMPQCLLRVARFRGVDRTEFPDNRQFHGKAFTLLASAERFLRDTLPITGRIEADRIERIDEPLYPPLATRESLVNALCHRDYSTGGGSVGVAVYDDRLDVNSRAKTHVGFVVHATGSSQARVLRALGTGGDKISIRGPAQRDLAAVAAALYGVARAAGLADLGRRSDLARAVRSSPKTSGGMPRGTWIEMQRWVPSGCGPGKPVHFRVGAGYYLD